MRHVIDCMLYFLLVSKQPTTSMAPFGINVRGEVCMCYFLLKLILSFWDGGLNL